MASRTASLTALLGWALVATGALADALVDDPRVGLVGLPLAVALVTYVALPVIEARSRPRRAPRRRRTGLIRASAVLGAGVSAAVAYGGLVNGFELESALVALGGVVTVVAADLAESP